MKSCLTFMVLLLSAVGARAQIQAEAKTPKLILVDVAASEADAQVLLEKLNNHGREDGLSFTQDHNAFMYRIAFQIGHDTYLAGMPGPPHSGTITWHRYGRSNATCTVFDAKGEELFTFKRGGRSTDGGAANATAKEIIKQLLQN